MTNVEVPAGQPEQPEEPEQPPEDERQSSKAALGFVLLAVLLVPIGLVLYRIYPDGVPSKKDPGFVDNIFDNNLVVFAARLVLFSAAIVLAFAAAYTIVSIINWFGLRQWLTRAGPFEVSQEAVTTLKEEVDFWRNAAIEQNAEAQALQQQLETSDTTVEQLYERVLDQDAELERLREEQESDNA
jgi:cytoskeletal protein RodZ